MDCEERKSEVAGGGIAAAGSLSNWRLGMARKKKIVESPERTFGVRIPGHKTSVAMAEFSDGDIGVQLITEREGKESLVTTLKLHPITFGLLGAAMARASQGNWSNDA